MNIQVFVSYKRSSSFAYARLFHDLLEARLNCKVFMDLTSIGPGDDFVKSIQQAESSCSVVVVLIAREWLLIDQVNGKRPVDDPENWVRKEVTAALRRQIRIIPMLLGDISMPAAADLPIDISALASLQAIAIRDSEFDHDFERLIMQLEEEIGIIFVDKSKKALALRRFASDFIFYFPHFLKLIVIPKRVVRAFAANREEEVARAMAFLVISLLIFTVLSAPLFIDRDRMVVLLLVQFFMLLVLAVCSSAIIQLSWWCVGGKASFGRYLSINSYYWGVSSVLGICFVVAALGVLRTFDPHMIELLRKAATGDIQTLIAANPAKSVPLRASAWMVIIGNLLLLIWTYWFWGAYREINNTTRLSSLAAFCISCIVFIPVGIVYIFLQEGLFNLLK